eukprot:scaffold1173_cov405-Prasinococcus_capsulatus_cf.AAC.19
MCGGRGRVATGGGAGECASGVGSAQALPWSRRRPATEGSGRRRAARREKRARLLGTAGGRCAVESQPLKWGTSGCLRLKPSTSGAHTQAPGQAARKYLAPSKVPGTHLNKTLC